MSQKTLFYPSIFYYAYSSEYRFNLVSSLRPQLNIIIADKTFNPEMRNMLSIWEKTSRIIPLEEEEIAFDNEPVQPYRDKSAVTFTMYTVALVSNGYHNGLLNINGYLNLKSNEFYTPSVWKVYIKNVLFKLSSLYEGSQEWPMVDPRFASSKIRDPMQLRFFKCESFIDRSLTSLAIYALLSYDGDDAVHTVSANIFQYV